MFRGRLECVLFLSCITASTVAVLISDDPASKTTETTSTTTTTSTVSTSTSELTTTESKVDTTVASATTTLANPFEEIVAATGKTTEEALAQFPDAMKKVLLDMQSRPKNDCHAPQSSSLLEGGLSNASGKCICPVSVAGGNDNIDKYAERAKDGGCSAPRGMWMTMTTSPAVRFKYETVSKLFKLGPGMRVLDWGAGCGHQLDLVAGEYGFDGVGMDLISSNTEWALSHLKHLDNFCTVDGSGGIPFGNESFDAVVSNAALYHVDTFENQCKIVRDEVPQVLNPGGCMWFGWLGAHDRSTPQSWQECISANHSELVGAAIFEQAVFGVSEYESNTSYSLFVCKKSKE